MLHLSITSWLNSLRNMFFSPSTCRYSFFPVFGNAYGTCWTIGYDIDLIKKKTHNTRSWQKKTLTCNEVQFNQFSSFGFVFINPLEDVQLHYDAGTMFFWRVPRLLPPLPETLALVKQDSACGWGGTSKSYFCWGDSWPGCGSSQIAYPESQPQKQTRHLVLDDCRMIVTHM